MRVQHLPRSAALHRARVEHAHAGGDRHRRLPGEAFARRTVSHGAPQGPFTHKNGGFYHDGRFAQLRDVVDHYSTFLALGLTEGEKLDLIAYLDSL